MSKVKVVYFSPSGTTEKTVKTVAEQIGGDKEYYNILDHKLKKKISVAQDQLLILAMPVFGGRIPEYCHSSLTHIAGDDSPAVIICVYGNREFEDALVEMEDIVDRKGFHVIGAAAFVAQHSIFTDIAKDRPDQDDIDLMEDFGKLCDKKFAEYDKTTTTSPEIPGNRPYRKFSGVSLTPKGSRACNKCRTCVKICPVGAISGASPRKTDKKKCICCTACIAHCPTGARGFSGFKNSVGGKHIRKMCKERKEGATFI